MQVSGREIEPAATCKATGNRTQRVRGRLAAPGNRANQRRAIGEVRDGSPRSQGAVVGRWRIATSLFVRRRPLVRFRIIRGVNGNLIALVKPSTQVDQPAALAAKRHCRALLGLKLSATDRTFNASHRRSTTPAARLETIAPKKSSDANVRPASKSAGRLGKEIDLTLIARAAGNQPPCCITLRMHGSEPGEEEPRRFYFLLAADAHLVSALHAPLPHGLLPPADSEAAAFLYDSLR